ncbi:pentapeptide repeat-containing protein [Bradyrhizobium sp. HKCCYLRH3099]|uniref:pentapeptide repeat-containing protein n=1 Tax=unclassified Bradyrhizobium TaxID=2631580 RepID=UPI003EBD4673
MDDLQKKGRLRLVPTEPLKGEYVPLEEVFKKESDEAVSNYSDNDIGWNVVDTKFLLSPPAWFSSGVYIIVLSLILFAGWLFFSSVFELASLLSNSDKKTSSEAAKNILLTIGAAIAAPFVIWRTWIAHQQWRIGERQTTNQIEAIQTGLLVKAIEQLGAVREEKIPINSSENSREKWETKSETVANIEIRVGAIYLLRRLAEDNERDRGPILQTLCTYIRENSQQEAVRWARREAARFEAQSLQGDPAALLQKIMSDNSAELSEFRVSPRRTVGGLPALLPRLREDIQAALRVIGDKELHRSNIGSHLNLAGSFLPKADMRNLCLEAVDFTGAQLQFADFSGARCQGGKFRKACCQGANFAKANCFNANFVQSQCSGMSFNDVVACFSSFNSAFCSGVAFGRANLELSSFDGAIVEFASFTSAKCKRAQFRKANLKGSSFFLADCAGSDFRNSKYSAACFDFADLTYSKGLTTEGLSEAFGNGETKLPVDVGRPSVAMYWINCAEVDLDEELMRKRMAMRPSIQEPIFAEKIWDKELLEAYLPLFKGKSAG